MSMNALDAALQYLSNDESAVQNLPYVLSVLIPPNSSLLATPSPSRKLWLARVNSLQERPKHPGARWAGFVLAQRTAQLSRDLLLTSADNWISYALPTLSRDEPLPTLNAAIHLLCTVYTTISDMPEFHRKVVVPSAQKFSIALIQLAEKPETPIKLKALCMHSLTSLVHHHPTLHVAAHARLQNLTLSHLSGSYPSTSDSSLVSSAADLHSVLHLTGGKVRGATAWRKNVDATVASVLSTLSALTSPNTTSSNQNAPGFDLPSIPSETFQVAIPVAIDRLRSLVALLVSLLRSPTSRPVTYPIGALATLTQRLIGVDVLPAGEKTSGYTDPARLAMQSAAVPALWQMGCTVMVALSTSVTKHLTPYVSQFASALVHHLDQPLPSEQRLHFLRALAALLSNSHSYPITNNFLSTRLVRSLLPCLSNLLAEGVPGAISNGVDDHSSAKAKKKTKMYEGDEVFKTTRDLLLRSASEGEEVLLSMHILPSLISSPHTNPAVSSVATRLLLTLLLQLLHMPPSFVSTDPSMHGRIFNQVIGACNICIVHDPNNAWSRKALGILAQVLGHSMEVDHSALRSLSLLIHPHLPPTHKTLSTSLEGIPLYRVEGKEERETREAMGLISLDDPPPSNPVPVAAAQQSHQMHVDESRAITVMAQQTHSPRSSDLVQQTQPTGFGFHTPLTTTSPQVVSSAPSTTPLFSPPTSVEQTPNPPTFAPSPPLPYNSASAPATYAYGSNAASARQDDDDMTFDNGEDSDDDDEPIPEINMGSDSDEE